VSGGLTQKIKETWPTLSDPVFLVGLQHSVPTSKKTGSGITTNFIFLSTRRNFLSEFADQFRLVEIRLYYGYIKMLAWAQLN